MSASNSPFAWLTRLFTRWTQSLDQKYGWHTFPLSIGLMILIGLRTILRQKNPYDATGVKLTVPDSSSSLLERTLPEVADRHAREVAKQVSMTDLYYSLGISSAASSPMAASSIWQPLRSCGTANGAFPGIMRFAN